MDCPNCSLLCHIVGTFVSAVVTGEQVPVDLGLGILIFLLCMSYSKYNDKKKREKNTCLGFVLLHLA